MAAKRHQTLDHCRPRACLAVRRAGRSHWPRSRLGRWRAGSPARQWQRMIRQLQGPAGRLLQGTPQARQRNLDVLHRWLSRRLVPRSQWGRWQPLGHRHSGRDHRQQLAPWEVHTLQGRRQQRVPRQQEQHQLLLQQRWARLAGGREAVWMLAQRVHRMWRPLVGLSAGWLPGWVMELGKTYPWLMVDIHGCASLSPSRPPSPPWLIPPQLHLHLRAVDRTHHHVKNLGMRDSHLSFVKWRQCFEVGQWHPSVRSAK